MNNKKTILKNGILLLAVCLIIGAALYINKTSAFDGTDGQASDVVLYINKQYKPWSEPLWEPPSKEIESMMFSLQAALGALVCGYVAGFYRGKRKVDR